MPSTDSLRSSTSIKSILKVGGGERKIKYQALFGPHHLSASKRSLLPWAGASNTPGRVRAPRCRRDALPQQLPPKGLPKHPTSSYSPPLQRPRTGDACPGSGARSPGSKQQRVLCPTHRGRTAGSPRGTVQRRLRGHAGRPPQARLPAPTCRTRVPTVSQQTGFWLPKESTPTCPAAAGGFRRWSISNRPIEPNKQAPCGYPTCSRESHTEH